jgi:polyhydroxyalkanoic acid synthase PhaR subunit
MSDERTTHDLFSMWKHSMEQGVDAWRMLVGQPQPPDVFQFWRPMFGQAMDLWTQMLQKGAAGPDGLAQWKRFLDDSVEAWSKVLGQAMETEGFAAAMGKFLEQYLNTVGPMRKALHSSSEDFLRSMNLPSRKQVIDLAGQVVSLETRTEALEEQIEKLAEGLPPESPSKKQVSDLASQIVSLEVRLGSLAQRIEELVGGTARLELLLKRAGEPQATPSA